MDLELLYMNPQYYSQYRLPVGTLEHSNGEMRNVKGIPGN